MTLSEKIVQLRKSRNLSQEALAEQLGVSRQTVAKWETGELVPDANNIVSVSRFFGVAADYLLGTTPGEPESAADVSPVIPVESSVPADDEPILVPVEDGNEKSGNSTVKKIIAVVVTLCIIAGAACFPLYSKAIKRMWNKLNGNDPESYPYVLVHGLGGWGDNSETNSAAYYWGATSGSLVSYLNGEGYEVYAPAVGPVSSSWDRACELYAQLTGTKVDYGEAHSKAHGHERYGREYTTPLLGDWGKRGSMHEKINLVGHSFGGTTVRLFASLLANGDEAEKALGGEISPLFKGGNADLINSVTTLCAPHNGSSLTCIADELGAIAGLRGITGIVAKFIFSTAQTLAPAGGIYDFMLDQFGIGSVDGNENGFKSLLDRLMTGGNTDNAIYELSPDGAAELNKSIKTVKSIYYFSYSYCTTKKGTLLGGQVPAHGTLAVLMPTAAAMGSYTGTSKGGIEIDDTWKPNDGLVSVVSAKYPFGEEHIDLPTEYKEIKKGIWNVVPTRDGDHSTVVGLNTSADSMHKFYDELFSMISNLR